MFNYVFEHLEKPKSYDRILFADLSSAFNTIKPHLPARKLMQLNVNVSREIILWILSFLTEWKQRVCIEDVMSPWITASTGAPQGCVLSPVLFIIYTNDCRCSNDNFKLIKFSDDSSIVDCSCSQTEYELEAQDFFSWCKETSRQLNISKTKEFVN